jgi:TPR repeat protein
MFCIEFSHDDHVTKLISQYRLRKKRIMPLMSRQSKPLSKRRRLNSINFSTRLAQGKEEFRRKEYSGALAIFTEMATVGSADGMFYLGLMYQDGLGVSQDYTKAREYYEESVTKGNVDAMNNLGFMYSQGQGVPIDYLKAKELFEKAIASNNLVDAMVNLGDLYYHGHGIPQDYVEAQKWYQRAVEAGDIDVHRRLGWMYESGRGSPPDMNKAIAAYEIGAKNGHAPAMYSLGVISVMGNALRWWMK